eukprot:TRINITY_DN11077_c0_g1_i1.p3 TRINITY_DN11077_c0_g1~~TRINITY_DN11077_c0_g1_i1.p3  ORF type:complete len:124 (-),score=5.84 TRINITY_DN11077_c0_g1_i1:47-418(-)
MKTAFGFRAFWVEFNKQYSLAVAWMINSLAYSIIYPFIPIYLYQERGFSMNMVGLLFPVMGVGTIIAMPLTGWLTDKVGRYFVIQLGPVSYTHLTLPTKRIVQISVVARSLQKKNRTSKASVR